MTSIVLAGFEGVEQARCFASCLLKVRAQACAATGAARGHGYGGRPARAGAA